MNITLGEEQEQVLNNIQEYIKSGTAPACLYYGSAGTGKSVLVNHIIQFLERNNIQYCLCAPTHKAALVLSRFTNRDAITLHKLLSLSPTLDIFALDFNNLLFKMGVTQAEMPYNGIVICDESSMINDDLYEVLIKKCSEFGTRIIFTGDFKQIQPVKQDYLSKIIHTQPQWELTKIWRQSSENGLLPVLSELREHPLNRFYENLGTEGSLLTTSNAAEFLKEGIVQFKKAVQKSDILETKILCYTNDRVHAYNNVVHKYLFPGEKEYNKGEFLIGCENIEFNKHKFFNSMDYIVISEPVKTDIFIPNFGRLPAYKLELYDSLTKTSAFISILSKDISKDYMDSLACKIEDYRLNAVSWSSINKAKARFYWKAYYEMIGSFTTPIDFYYDGRLIRKKSFDYSYAITTHKSQGSTFNNALVDIKNINICQDENVRRQLQYVALSRTQHNVLIYQ